MKGGRKLSLGFNLEDIKKKGNKTLTFFKHNSGAKARFFKTKMFLKVVAEY